MAIDEAERAESGQVGADEDSEQAGEEAPPSGPDPVAVGRYTWADFMDEHGHGGEVSDLYPEGRPTSNEAADVGLSSGDEVGHRAPRGSDWSRVTFDPEGYLGFHPDDLAERITETAAARAKWLDESFEDFADPETTPVTKDVWMWEHFKREYYYQADGSRPRNADGSVQAFDGSEYLSFDPDETEGVLAQAGEIGRELDRVVEERSVNVQEDLDEDEFFSDEYGNTTVTNRYDLEKAVSFDKKTHFVEEQRYWVNKPYSFVIIFHSRKENETKYYAIEPNLNEIEEDLREFLVGKLRTAIKYADEDVAAGADSTEAERRAVIDRETKRLLNRYDLFESVADDVDEEEGFFSGVLGMLGDEPDELPEDEVEADDPGPLDGIEVRPEPVVLDEDPETLTEYQIEKLLYLLKRDFIGYERIDPIKHDINVEDISCDGYDSPVFVYHTDYEQIISNVYHGQAELDDFVVKLAQRSGKGISKRRPQVDATLPDGSRAQLTLGREVSDHGTNYTIRQFKDVPFTPIDLINWKTFSLEEMAFLWLCIENHKSLIFAGGTASGKTTSLNAVSLFIPSSTKIVSIEDTREVELPQRNWIASVTRPSFSDDDQGDVDEFDLLEAALRQRPDYIVMGEIRGEEGRTLFQVMSTGHTTYTTFHADSVGEVLKRFTTDPINVSKTMFTALDLVSIQTQTRVHGHKVRRNKVLTEVNHYDAENDEINVQDVYQWQAETDEFLKLGDSNTLEEIKFDRGWNQERLDREIFKREVILAYLIKNGLNEYREVAATIQAFINDPDTILTLIANGQLEDSLEDLREMESVLIDVDPEKEALVPRPDPDDEGYNLAMSIIDQADEALFDEYRGREVEGLETALDGVDDAEASVEGGDQEISFEGEVADDFEGEFAFGGDSAPFDVGAGSVDDSGTASAEADATGTDDDPFSGGPDWLGGDESSEDMWAEAREALEGEVDDRDATGGGPDELPEENEPTPPELEDGATESPDGEPESDDQASEPAEAPPADPDPADGSTDTTDAASTAPAPSGTDREPAAGEDEPAGEDAAGTDAPAAEDTLDSADGSDDEAPAGASGADSPDPTEDTSTTEDAPSSGGAPGADESTASTDSDAAPSPGGPFAGDGEDAPPGDSAGGGPFSEATDDASGGGPFADSDSTSESSTDDAPFGGSGSGGPFRDADDEPTAEDSDEASSEESPFDDDGPFSDDGPFADDGDDEDDE